MSPRPRVPPPLDVEAILGALDRHRVEYVLIGGLAARIHGSPFLTEDLDITPALDRENLARLATALQELGARLRGAEEVEFPLDDRSLASADVLTMTTRAVIPWCRLKRVCRMGESGTARAPMISL